MKFAQIKGLLVEKQHEQYNITEYTPLKTCVLFAWIDDYRVEIVKIGVGTHGVRMWRATPQNSYVDITHKQFAEMDMFFGQLFAPQPHVTHAAVMIEAERLGLHFVDRAGGGLRTTDVVPLDTLVEIARSVGC